MPLRLLVLACLLLAACPAPSSSPAPLYGDGWTLSAQADGTLELKRGAERLLAFPPGAFEIATVPALDDTLSYDPFWLVVNDGIFTPAPPKGLRWNTATGAEVDRTGAGFELRLTYANGLTGTVTASTSAAGQPVLHFTPGTPASGAVASLRVNATVDPSEAFYGLGEWLDDVNHRGKVRPMQLEADLNIESVSTENHVTVPLLIGTRGWGLFVESHRFGLFEVATKADDVVSTTWGTAEQSAQGLTVHLFSAPTPLQVLKPYYALTGAPKPPALWALGPWIWRNESRDEAEVRADVQLIRTLDLATSGLWIDRPYATDVNTFDFDAARYQDAPGMIAAARAAGLRVALWHTPYLTQASQPMRAEAEAQGYFPVEQGPWINRWSAPLDFTHPGAQAFWQDLLRRYTALGVEGWKLDFAEDVAAGLSGRGTGWKFADGSTERTMHDGYTRLYHQAYRGVLPDEPGFFLVRSGKWGTQANGVVIWPGDIDATLTKFGEVFTDRTGKTAAGVGGLPAAIRAGVSLSASGFPYFAADTGGYRHSPPDKETFCRWVEQSALMPVMQTGDASSQPPWVFTPENGRDAQALDLYRRYARLHARLFPYFWSLIQHQAVDGLPPVRAFGLAYPRLGRHPGDVYLLGDDLLVAPVASPGAVERTFPRPPGEWASFWDGAALGGVEGADVTVAAPLEVLPLFLRAGALVPMLRPTIDTLAPATDLSVESFANDPGDLWVRVAPASAPSHFEVYDGTALSQSPRDGLTLRAVGGSVFEAAVVWEVPGSAAPTAVTHGGDEILAMSSLAALDTATSGWWHDAGTTWVKTPLDGAPTVVR